MAPKGEPPESPHTPTRTRVSTIYHPRPRLNLPSLPPHTPINRKQILQLRREAKALVKRTDTVIELTYRAMLKARGENEKEHANAINGGDVTTDNDIDDENEAVTSAEQISEIVPEQVQLSSSNGHETGSYYKYPTKSGPVNSPPPALTLSPAHKRQGSGQRSKIPVAVSSVVRYRVLSQSIKIPTKTYDGRRTKRNMERTLD